MCNSQCLDFIKAVVRDEEIRGKLVLESGARDVNGSFRPYLESFHPMRYVGTDLMMGKGVDQVCDAVDLVKTFGERSFDVLVSTEVIEHVKDWRAVVSNYKRVLRPNGLLFLTTRSEGFPFHEYPIDAWRYELSDMAAIFEDFKVLNLNQDPSEPGVFLKAQRPRRFIEKSLWDYELYSVSEMRRVK